MLLIDLASKKVTQVAWTLVNDSFKTIVCLQYPARDIAGASLYLACRLIGEPLPTKRDRSFFESIDQEQNVIECRRVDVDISDEILDMYNMKAKAEAAKK